MHDLEKRTAEAYEELLVPALFEPWSRRLINMADVKPGDSVLDVACGTGIFARSVTKKGGSTRSISGVDLNPAMLEIAGRLASEVDWCEGDAESLPYEDESFSIVVSQFGLMFVPSPVTALKEMYRVLERGGTMALVVFDSLANNPAYEELVDVYNSVAGPRVAAALRFPFSMGDRRELAATVREAGISGATISSHKEKARFADAKHMVLADVKGWFPFAQLQLDESEVAAIIDEAETALSSYRDREGTIEFPVSAHVVVARKA